MISMVGGGEFLSQLSTGISQKTSIYEIKLQCNGPLIERTTLAFFVSFICALKSLHSFSILLLDCGAAWQEGTADLRQLHSAHYTVKPPITF